MDDHNLNECTPEVVAVAKRCMQHNEQTRPSIKEIYGQLRDLVEAKEPESIGDVPQALYGSSELDIVLREMVEAGNFFFFFFWFVILSF